LEVLEVADCEFLPWDSFALSDGGCELDGETGCVTAAAFHPSLHEAEREREEGARDDNSSAYEALPLAGSSEFGT
jgi:hypothetical protein